MSNSRKALLMIGDMLAIWVSFFAMLAIRFGMPIPEDILGEHLGSIIILFVLWMIIFYIFNLYELSLIKVTIQSLRNIILALMLSFVVGVILFYLAPLSVTPKTNLVIAIFFFGFLVILWRRLFIEIFAKNFKINIVFLGSHNQTSNLEREILNHPYLGYRIIKSVENLDELKDIKQPINLLIINKSLNKDELEIISNNDYEILDIRQAYQRIFFKLPVELIDDSMALSIVEHKDNRFYYFLRKILDYFFALLILIVSSPVLAIASVAILIEDGKPIIYRQERVGFRGKIFHVIKLRSMKTGAENSGLQTQMSDSRITKVGRIIRKLHIDEIPQMLNIIRGDISFIGPRPEWRKVVEKAESEVPYYFLRYNIKPGFTGWAQIKFRNSTNISEVKEKLEYDLFYLKNRNFFMDLGIVLKTIQIIFTH